MSQLLLAEVRIDERQGEHVEGEVPGRVPGVLPLVRHGDDVGVVHVVPVVVARPGLARLLERVGAALLQPLVDVVVVELLAPQHAGQGLAHDVGGRYVQRRCDGLIEQIRLLAARLQPFFKVGADGRQVVFAGKAAGTTSDSRAESPRASGINRHR
jgi:hypothetical protein